MINEATLTKAGLDTIEAQIIIQLARVKGSYLEKIAERFDMTLDTCKKILEDMTERTLLVKERTIQGTKYSLHPNLATHLEEGKRGGDKDFSKSLYFLLHKSTPGSTHPQTTIHHPTHTKT